MSNLGNNTHKIHIDKSYFTYEVLPFSVSDGLTLLARMPYKVLIMMWQKLIRSGLLNCTSMYVQSLVIILY